MLSQRSAPVFRHVRTPLINRRFYLSCQRSLNVSHTSCRLLRKHCGVAATRRAKCERKKVCVYGKHLHRVEPEKQNSITTVLILVESIRSESGHQCSSHIRGQALQVPCCALRNENMRSNSSLVSLDRCKLQGYVLQYLASSRFKTSSAILNHTTFRNKCIPHQV